MRNFFKKQGILLGLACLGGLCLSRTAYLAQADGEAVAEVDGAQYQTIAEALLEWDEGETLTLLSDAQTEMIATSENKTLDLNGYILTGEASERVIQVAQNTLNITDSAPTRANSMGEGGYITGGRGILISAGASLNFTGGTVAGNSRGENGSGVNISNGATMRMSGGAITQNEGLFGGGVYAGGTLSLSGNAVIKENYITQSGNQIESNLYLPENHEISYTSFSGEVGITMAQAGVFARAEHVNGFFADNLSYTTAFENGVAFLQYSPVAQATATLKDGAVIYPTTSLSQIKEQIEVVATNENGVPYAGAFKFEIEETPLTVGDNELFLNVTDENEGSVQTSVVVPVQTPALMGIDVVYEQKNVLYYDSPLSRLEGDLTVTGSYTDGMNREIFSSAQATQAGCGEDYITDHYTLSGDLNFRQEGKASVTVAVGGFAQEILVEISKYQLTVKQIEVTPAEILQQSGAWNLSYRAFTPNLTTGIEPIVYYNGQPLSASSLPYGVYTVQVAFEVVDTDNFEPILGQKESKLTVNASVMWGKNPDGTQSNVAFFADGGIAPTWEFETTDISADLEIKGSYIVGSAYKITLRENGLVYHSEKPVTVQLLIPEEMKTEQVKLYRLCEDGSLEEVQATRMENHFTFQTQDLEQSKYVVAYEKENGWYLGLGIGFGVFCLLGAGGLLVYIAVKKRKE